MSLQNSLDQFDVLVLGAGIIGVSTALHLQARARRVCLVDRDQPGTGASYGNAGLIERSSVIPYAFPRSLPRLLHYALNRQADVRYQPTALPGMAGWLWRYWRQSAPGPLAAAAHDMLPLIERSVLEHDALIAAAGLQGLVRTGGWIDVYRNPSGLAAAVRKAHALQEYGLDYEVLDAAALHAREPGARSPLIGGVHWRDPKTVEDPAALVRGYADLFLARGGSLLHADARTLRTDGTRWSLAMADNRLLSATEAVIALGPDAQTVLSPLGYKFPIALKRGYHLHYRPIADAPVLNRPICDSIGGYVLAPMRQGIRLTTGVEIAHTDAPVNLTQIRRAHALALQIFPLGEVIEPEPWLGRRPCLPDMRPIIGPAPRHRGLWLNFGHAHHGLTLGPACGRLLAEVMTGAQPFADLSPYSANRFP